MKLFKELADTSVREEKSGEKSALEHILDCEKNIIDTFLKDEVFEGGYITNGLLYEELIIKTQNILQQDFISESMIQAYIHSRENTAKDTEAHLRGMYSSALLQLLCMKNSNQVTIDGRGKEFNFLFFMLKYAGNVTVKNFRGKNILAGAGSFGGSIKNIDVSNIIGDGVLRYCAIVKGKAENIVATRLKGAYLISSVGADNGSAKNVTITNCVGDNILSWLGCQEGSAENIVATYLIGDNALAMTSANKGYAKNVASSWIKGRENYDHSFIENHRKYAHFIPGKRYLLKKITQLSEKISEELPEKRKMIHKEIARLQKLLFGEKD